jgi:RNA polymerase sigma factor (sigma-70 family)
MEGCALGADEKGDHFVTNDAKNSVEYWPKGCVYHRAIPWSHWPNRDLGMKTTLAEPKAVSVAEKALTRAATQAGGMMPETRWSLVQRVQEKDDGKALTALGELMKIYWEPLRAFALGRGESPSDVEDVVQGFYEMLITRGSMLSVNQERGRLRSFLRASFERYLIDQWDKRSAVKRGGGKRHLSLEQEQEENHSLKELSHDVTPDKLFERRWVLTVLGRVMDSLHASYVRRGKEDIFMALKGALEWQSTEFSYAEAGERIGMNENAVKQAVFRMRKKFGELLRWEVAQTVTDPADVDAELRELLHALGD